MTAWLMFGCRTTVAPEIAEIIWRRAEELAVLVDNLPDPPEVEWAVGSELISAEAITDAIRDLATVIPQTTPGPRRQVAAAATRCGLSRFPALVDPTAVVGRTADVADGVVVNSSANIGAMSVVDQFVFINRGATLGHHVSVGRFACLAPRVVINGSVTIGEGAFVGAGAVILPNVTVGAGATIGAGAVILEDVEPGAVVVGNPGRVVRRVVADLNVVQGEMGVSA